MRRSNSSAGRQIAMRGLVVSRCCTRRNVKVQSHKITLKARPMRVCGWSGGREVGYAPLPTMPAAFKEELKGDPNRRPSKGPPVGPAAPPSSPPSARNQAGFGCSSTSRVRAGGGVWYPDMRGSSRGSAEGECAHKVIRFVCVYDVLYIHLRPDDCTNSDGV